MRSRTMRYVFQGIWLLTVAFFLVNASQNAFAATTRWDFASSTQGWTGHKARVWSGDGFIYADPEGLDPGIASPSLSISACSYGVVRFRLGSNCPDLKGRVYFRTSSSGWTEAKSVGFSVIPGKGWNTYSVNMTGNANWSGAITGIRIDPADSGSVSGGYDLVAYDWVEFVASSGAVSGGVRDYHTGQAIGNAAVRLEQNNVIKKDPVYSSYNGVYTIGDVPPGTYRLVGMKTGYQNWFEDGKSVCAGKDLSGQNIRLKKEPPILNGVSINNGASTTQSRSVNLSISSNNNPTHYQASERSDFSGAAWNNYTSSPSFTLSSGFGAKTVYVRLKNNTGNSTTRSDGITLAPTPRISASRSAMSVGEAIDLYCDLGADGPGRPIAFFVDPGSAGMFTRSGGNTNSAGRASKRLTADADWSPKTTFACRDELSGRASGYDADVTVSQALLRAPGLIKPIGNETIGALLLQWERVPGASGYKLEIDHLTPLVDLEPGSRVSYEPDLRTGPHVWRACTKNGAGVCGPWSDEERFTYNRDPRLEISLDENKISHGWKAWVNVSADDPDGEETTCQWRVNSGGWSNAPNRERFEIGPENFVIGVNRIDVTCTDVHGGSDSDSEELTDYAVPARAPGALSPAGEDLDVKASYKFEFSGVGEPGHGQRYHYQVVIADNDAFVSPVYDAEVAGSPFNVSGYVLPPGKTYYWKICGENDLQTPGPRASESFRITSGNNPPIVSATLDEDEISHGWNAGVVVASHDPEKDAYSCRYKVNSGDWKPAPANDRFTILSSELGHGDNEICVRCTDIRHLYGETCKNVYDWPLPTSAPESLSPRDGNVIDIQPAYPFTFSETANAHHYQVIIADNSLFGSPLFNEEVERSPFHVSGAVLPPGKIYFWKIRGKNKPGGPGPWAEAHFTIPAAEMGLLARKAEDPDVYWIKYGLKWPFLDRDVFLHLGYTDDMVQTYPSDHLDSLPPGKTILQDNDNFVYRKKDSSTVYIIRNGKSDWFIDWDAFINSEFGSENVYWAADDGFDWIQSVFPPGRLIERKPRIRISPEKLYIE
ncbi:MAG: carboxypeptidase regulatory-like domain-containing protein [Desulfobacterales bacterium]|nr:carboxypeptidase regulatory-like domain-containing protein [Desulfobacterales bacterium]